jgi:hypothetical protein
MTTEEVVRRVRALLERDQDLDRAIATVVDTIAQDADEAAAFVRLIGPTALRRLQAQAPGKALVATDSSGRHPSPKLEWGKPQVQQHLRFMRALYGGVRDHLRRWERVEKNMKDGETVEDALPRLNADDRAAVLKDAGVKRLAVA